MEDGRLVPRQDSRDSMSGRLEAGFLFLCPQKYPQTVAVNSSGADPELVRRSDTVPPSVSCRSNGLRTLGLRGYNALL